MDGMSLTHSFLMVSQAALPLLVLTFWKIPALEFNSKGKNTIDFQTIFGCQSGLGRFDIGNTLQVIHHQEGSYVCSPRMVVPTIEFGDLFENREVSFG